MKKILSCSAVLLVLCAPQPVSAQGWGGFMHWINRLGPQFGGGGLSVFADFGPEVPGSDFQRKRFKARLSGAHAWVVASDDFIDPDGSSITMLSINPMLEFRLLDTGSFGLEIAAGASFNRFGGDVDAFWHTSYPGFLQAGWSLSTRWELKGGVGARYYPAFEATDFDPLIVDVERTDGEITFPDFFLGFDFYFN